MVVSENEEGLCSYPVKQEYILKCRDQSRTNGPRLSDRTLVFRNVEINSIRNSLESEDDIGSGKEAWREECYSGQFLILILFIIFYF